MFCLITLEKDLISHQEIISQQHFDLLPTSDAAFFSQVLLVYVCIHAVCVVFAVCLYFLIRVCFHVHTQGSVSVSVGVCFLVCED